MSEMTLFSKGGNTLPAHLRNLELDETTKALMGSGGASGKRISIKGGVFRMIVDGKEIAQNEDRAMNIVIVAANANVSRSYYEDTYVEGQVLAPTCWSNDGISPDAKVSEPQSGKCASCPQNIAGSAESGKGRACRFSQRLAVTLENDLKGDVYQLTLPAQSIFGNVENGKMPLQAYAKFLGSHGLPITAIVTEMRFDTASATPKLTFKAVRPLEADEMAVAQRVNPLKPRPPSPTTQQHWMAQSPKPHLHPPLKRKQKNQKWQKHQRLSQPNAPRKPHRKMWLTFWTTGQSKEFGRSCALVGATRV